MNEESKPDSVRNTDVASSINKLLQNRASDQDEFEEKEPIVNTPSLDTTVNSATGIEAFDEILDGGFPKGAVVLLAGSSGSGKSIFSFQWLFEGNKKQENGVYISLTEPLFKIVENLEKMEYYNREAIEQEQLKIIDIRDQFRASEYKSEAIIDFIEKVVKETNVKRLCIDSITAIAYHYNDKSKIRTFIFELGTILATLGCTTILTSEVARTNEYSVYDVEEFISDAIIRLDQIKIKDSYQRQLRIVKVRGKKFQSETIPMKITSAGIEVYPKTRPPLSFDSTEKRMSTGNQELDYMIEGGFIQGSTMLVAGTTGTGKTILSVQYIIEGLNNGEQCLFISFEESAQQLKRNALAFGWDLAEFEKNGTLILYCTYPSDHLLEEHFLNIKHIIEKHQIQRCVIDSLSALSHEFFTEEFSDFALRINGFLKTHQVTNMFTASTDFFIGGSTLVEHNLSTLTDGIIMLRYVEMQGKLETVINILKMRASTHHKDLRRFTISTDKGISILESLTNYEGVMTGSGKRIKELEEEKERLQSIIEEKERTENELQEAKEVLTLMNKSLKHKVAEQTQSFSEQQQKSQILIQRTPYRIVHKNKELLYEFANDTFLHDINKDLSGLIGLSDFDLFPQPIAEQYVENDRKALQEGRILTAKESYLKQGEEVEITKIIAPLRNPEGEITGVIHIFWEKSQEETGNHDHIDHDAQHEGGEPI